MDSGSVPGRTTRGSTTVKIVAVAALAALTAAGCGGTDSGSGTGSASSTGADAGTGTGAGSTAGGSASGLQATYEKVIQQVLPSVVQIKTGKSTGSGIIFDDKGDVVTNAHVVGDAKQAKVLLATSSKAYPATLVGIYRPDDLAVIKVSGASNLHPADFADSSKARPGQIVLAMGSPLGLQSSVTSGIVSAVGRTVSEPASGNSPGATLPNAIQTSAPINPGNSGGALVTLSHQVLGIPTLAAVDKELGGAAQGIGFAIPSNTAKTIAKQLIEHGKVVSTGRAALDITARTVAGSDGRPAGVGVVSVQSGGSAADAGLQAGDVITKLAGTPTPTVQALTDALLDHDPGDTVKLTVTDPSGSNRTVQIKLDELKAG